ncbi:hypothetical protein CU041_12685 [Thalassospira povalilytica]|uniref:Uncharacterized protein n=2 Tax=Thalassospiraceae TaxID=2844866 RepID=A0ABX4R753_9PROT|nr:hypothetical protein CU041_12685 [Thalassospira povalilytica]
METAMQAGAVGGAGYAPNPIQIQQAAAPISETGSNDLNSPQTQRIEQTAETQTSQQAAPAPTGGRGQVIDIYA